MTTHNSKGLAADTVIIFVEYLIDRYKNTLKFEDHYVAITRAKSKIILIDNKTNYVSEINRLLCNNNGNFSFDNFIERRNLWSLSIILCKHSSKADIVNQIGFQVCPYIGQNLCGFVVLA
ncbi:ATP-binding domain-containing protein [Streptococcus agalactiae]|uniref:ATP-binding domain-containing protein n=1 Tax=Streptococcus agalactiae TaxID=1311 RepID=UPI003EF8E5E7